MSDSSESNAHADAAFDPFAGPAIALSVASTEAQREVWTATQMGGDASRAFNEAVTIRLRGALDRAALHAALNDLIARHEALRATFSRDGLLLLIGEAAPVDLPLLDLAALTPEARAERRTQLLERVVTEEFDLEHGPLSRQTLVRLSEEEYELVFSAHHIICDGWSLGVIAGDLGALYTARRNGTVAALPPAEKFTDYARDEVLQADAPERIAAEHYWLSLFRETIPVLELPSDRPRQAIRTFASARVDHVLPADLSRAVRATAARSGNSLFVALLGGFTSVLHRLSGQDDIVVGVPSAGQSATGRTSLVGHCVNMLPLRLHPTPAAAFDAFLADVRSTSLDAFDHQSLGFGSLLEKRPVVRDPSRCPLVSVIFNLDRSLPASAMPFDGLHAELFSVPRAYENFDLFLNAVETDAGIVLECQYNRDLYDAATIRRWLTAYEQMLSAAAAAPDTSLGMLPVLTPDDLATLARCNETALPVPAETLVHRMFEAQVRRTPDAIAVECDGERVSYATLNRRANRLARHLLAQGADRGQLVGLCLDRTPDLLVGLMAVLKAGAGYVPLDPNYPVDRLSYMAEDANLAVLVTDAATAAELRLPAAATVRIDVDAATISTQPDSDLTDAPGSSPEDTAYVIYTSGSTGKPKGVLVPHRSVVNLLASVQREPGLRADDTMLAITTLSFDIAVSEVILPLTVGARIVLASRDVASDGGLLMELIESSGVTFIDATPATYRLLLSAGWKGRPSLRVICTGEAMPRDLAETLTGCAGEVWNGYGPTETTVWSTFARVTSPVQKVLIGRPVANTRISIVDPQGQQVPIGVAGEMFIGGRGVTKGYLNRADLTAERFVPDPVAPGALVYRTGDLVRLLPSGELECLGRNDNQVKVRGFRIEPGEIEAVLMRCPGVDAAVVIAREDRVNDVRLVGYVAAASETVVNDAMRATLRGALPDYMVPGTIVRLDTLPLTPSGKVDRRALPAPRADVNAVMDSDFVAPRSESEHIIAELWAEALGLGRVSIRDDFFTLGGHSLLATQVLSRLRRDYGVQLSFRRIFEAPTVEQLAALMDAARTPGAARAPEPELAAIPHRAERASAPLTVLQERLWLLEELEPAQQAAHGHAASWLLRGPLDRDRMDQAFQSLVARHDTLRTSFHVIDGERRQVVHPIGALALRHLDFTSMDDDAQRSEMAAFFRTQQRESFDLSRAPLLRATLIRLRDDLHLLYTLQHGMVWDGWSFDIFLRDITQLYGAACDGRAPQLRPLPVNYGDFAVWQSAWLASPEAEAQREWWRSQLAGQIPELNVPADFPRPELPTYAGDQTSIEFTAEEAEQLRSLARRYDATLYMVLFAAYNVLLNRYTGLTDLMVGSPVRARTRPELEDMIGPFVNTVLLRTQVDPEQTFGDMLRDVRDLTLDAFSHQELPFELLGARIPPLRALFSMQDARERPAAMGSLSVEQYHVPQCFATNDLMLWTMESRQKLIAVLNYSTEMFELATAKAFLTQLRELLLTLRTASDVPLSSVALSPAAASAATARPVHDVGGMTVLDGVQRHAVASPTRTALRDDDGLVTYGELAERMTRIAGGLRAAGVPEGAAVGVLLPAGARRVTAMLGALAGGYDVVPLDAAAPVAFQTASLAATGAQAVIGAGTSPAGASLRMLSLDALHSAAPAAGMSRAGAVILTTPAATGGVASANVALPVLTAQLAALTEDLAVGTDDVVMITLEDGSPLAVLEALLPLWAGACGQFASEDARDDAAELAEALEDAGATVMFAPSGVWRTVVTSAWEAGPRFRGVMVLDAIPQPAEFHRFSRNVRGAYTLLMDAASGETVGVHRVQDGDVACFVGVPLVPSTLSVVDPAGRARPSGMPGRLRVEQGGGARTTGWQARFRADGRVELLSADTDALSLDAAAFAAAAVADALRSHGAIADAAVTIHRDLSGTPRLVAYVSAHSGMRFTDTELRNTIRSLLPRRCIPQRFVELSAIPRAADGAIITAALASPFVAISIADRMVPARTETERLLSEACQAALGVSEISMSDNFFKLGGTSLLCFRVVEGVRKATGQTLNPRALLVGTLQQAAAELDRSPSSVSSEASADARRSVVSRLRGLITGSAT